jgi:hypothetical protein
MAENVITYDTRLKLKYDSLAAWQDADPELLEGEVAIAYVDTTPSEEVGSVDVTSSRQVLFKVGPGKFSALQFSSAKAADVYSWAKQSEEAFTKWVKTLVTVKDIDLSDYYTKKETDTLLTGKVDVVTGKGLSTNDLTDELKGQYDAAYAHSQTTHIESVKVNGTALEIKDKAVDITVPTGALADKDKVAKEDLASDLANEIDSKVGSVAAGDASVTMGGTATAPTVAVKLSAGTDNAITLENDGLKVVIPAADTYSIVKDENSGTFAAVYHLAKNGTPITGSTINIPKDMVVDSGAVVTDPDGQPAGTYIKLVLQNVDEPLYINVGDLIEYVTSGSADGDMVVIDVSDDHKVTATITDGTITNDKIADGTIEASKLKEQYAKLSDFSSLFSEQEDAPSVTNATYADQAIKATRDGDGNEISTTYKKVQEVVEDPDAVGESLAFIDSLSQDEQGKVTVTKKNVKLSDYALKNHTHDIEELTQKENTYIVFDCGSATKNI